MNRSQKLHLNIGTYYEESQTKHKSLNLKKSCLQPSTGRFYCKYVMSCSKGMIDERSGLNEEESFFCSCELQSVLWEFNDLGIEFSSLISLISRIPTAVATCTCFMLLPI